MKKLFAIMFAGIMLFGFSACAPQEATDEQVVVGDDQQEEVVEEVEEIALDGSTINDKKEGIKLSFPKSWGIPIHMGMMDDFYVKVSDIVIVGKVIKFRAQEDKERLFSLYFVDKEESENYKDGLTCFDEDETYDYCYDIENDKYEDEAAAIASSLEVYQPVKKIVKLYYYNFEKDKEIDESIPCSADAVLSLEREVPESSYRPADVLRMLLRGDITTEEEAQGFQTEFAPGKLEFKSLSVMNGTATIEFKDDGGFSSGGSCRIGLLATQIQKTLLQFDSVDEVIFANQDMFQP